MNKIYVAALIAGILFTACKGQPKSDTGINRKGLDPFLTCFYHFMDSAGYTPTMLDYEAKLVQNGLLKSLSKNDYETYFSTYVGPEVDDEKRRCPAPATGFFKEFMATDCYKSMSRDEKYETKKTTSEELALLQYLADGGGFGGREELVETLISENRFSTREKCLFYLIVFMPL